MRTGKLTFILGTQLGITRHARRRDAWDWDTAYFASLRSAATLYIQAFYISSEDYSLTVDLVNFAQLLEPL